jgi:sodium transport system permease protein
VALGKWLAASLIGSLGVAATLAAAFSALRLPALAALPVALTRDVSLAVFALLLPVALLAASLQCFGGMQSQSFKEAQAHGNLLILAPMLPGFLIAFGSPLPERARFVPIIGHQLVIQDVLSGRPLQLQAALLLSAASVGLALAIALLLARQLERDATRLT